MSEKTLRKIIIALSVMTLVNIIAIIGATTALNTMRASAQTQVLGAAFYGEEESNVVEIGLIRPPRQMVNPGDMSEPNLTIINKANFQTYLRASYIIIIEDGEGSEVEDFENEVVVNINDGWEFKDGYWYYGKIVESGEIVPGPIDSIVYSNNFSDHRDYKVYLPLIVESVEASDNDIREVDYWPDMDIHDVDYKRLSESAKWTTGAEITIQ